MRLTQLSGSIEAKIYLLQFNQSILNIENEITSIHIYIYIHTHIIS